MTLVASQMKTTVVSISARNIDEPSEKGIKDVDDNICMAS